MKRTIFTLWCGTNPLTEIRIKNLQSIRDNSGCNVELITPNNINNYLIEPLHEGYQYLSAIHKSDYLRAYFAYFYGCGYSDIKECNFDWNIYFNQLENSKHAEVVSYSEAGGGGIALRTYSEVRYLPKKYCNYLLERSHLVIGPGHFIFKQYSSIAKNWRLIQHEILDKNMDTLINNPGTYHIGAVKGGVFGRYLNKDTIKFKGSKYPFCWSELGGMILQEVAFNEYEKCILTMPKPISGDHWK